jgi:hypothetical protein
VSKRSTFNQVKMNSIQTLIQEKIGHLLPCSQVLNFHDGMPSLPEGTGNQLRLMMGAGDLDHGGIPNTQLFATYDVFFCQPWDWNGSLVANVTHLLTTPGRLICFLDNNNPAHLEAFKTLFAGRFGYIDGHGGHCPHFSMDMLQALLRDGGTAANVYESSESCMRKDELLYWLDHGYFKGGLSDNFITCHIMGLTDEEEPALRARFLERVLAKARQCTQVTIDQTYIESSSLSSLQQISRVQMFDDKMPVNMTGAYVMVQKDWWSNPNMEFVVTKNPIDFKTDLVETHATKFGADHVDNKRCRLLIVAVQNDIANCIIYGGKAKYKTFLKHVQEKIEPIV